MPKIIVVSGPSGVGKGTILKELLRRKPELEVGLSWTTRDPRPGDDDGVKQYKYVTREEFMAAVDRGEFLEYAEYADNLYGSHIGTGETSLVLEIEVQGALSVRESCPDALLVGILPPGETSEEQLAIVASRLHGRGTDDEDSVARRLKTAQTEIDTIRSQWPHVIINEDVQRAEDELAILCTDYLRVA